MTQPQMKMFWPLFAEACRNRGFESKDEREAYRRKIMMEVCGVEHMKDISPAKGFDNLMCRLAEDAGEYTLAAKYAGGSAARYRNLILSRIRVIIGPDAKVTPEYYAASVLFQGRIVYRPFDTALTYGKKLEDADAWTEIPEATLRLLLQIVTEEFRKIVAK